MRYLFILLLAVVGGCAQPETPEQRAARERQEARDKAREAHLDQINRKAERMDEAANEQLRRQVEAMQSQSQSQ